jgi:hypothetical protein
MIMKQMTGLVILVISLFEKSGRSESALTRGDAVERVTRIELA